MSELGHKRTNRNGPKSTFVRFGPKADKHGRGWIVRYVPIATNAPQQTASLFDHLVGNGEHARGNGEAERFRGLEVDHELEFCRLNYRHIGGLGALENPAGVDADLTVCVGEVASIAHQASGRREFA